jgi:cellulose biosynthesis protein BcsQ
MSGKSKEYCSKQFLGTCEYLQEAKVDFDCLVKVAGNKRAMRSEGLVRELNKLRKEKVVSLNVQAQLETMLSAARQILKEIYAEMQKSPQPQDMNVRFSALYLSNLDEVLNSKVKT